MADRSRNSGSSARPEDPSATSEVPPLEISDAWLNARIDSGIGAVPEPADPSIWAAEVGGAITNAAAGDAIRISPDVMRRLRDRNR